MKQIVKSQPSSSIPLDIYYSCILSLFLCAFS